MIGGAQRLPNGHHGLLGVAFCGLYVGKDRTPEAARLVAEV
jgi:hypothetical protein